MFLGKTLHSYSASKHRIVNGERNAESNLAMDYHTWFIYIKRLRDICTSPYFDPRLWSKTIE